MSETFFSVIIPTYNRRKWLVDAINSVLSQKYKQFELIVIDDGSNDGTSELEILKNSRIQYIQKENKGPSSARNLGAQKAKYDTLAFLDSDDQWLPNKLAEQAKLFQETDFKASYTDEIWIRNGVRVNQHKHHYKVGGWIYLDCLPLCRISPSSIALKKDVFFELGMFNEEFIIAEDYDLWLKLTSKYEIGYIDKKLIKKFGGHEDQLSKNWGMDINRVKSLEWMLRNGDLKDEWRKETYLSLMKRLEILIKGFEKHGKHEEMGVFKSLKEEWSQIEVNKSC